MTQDIAHRQSAGTLSKREMPRHQRGSTVLEAALGTLTLVVLMMGIVEAGQMLYTYDWVCNLSRQATRYAIVRGSASGRAISASDVTTFVDAHAPSLQTSKLTATTTWSPNNAPGSTVKIKLVYSFPCYFPFPVKSINLQSTSQMVISQ